MSKEMNKLKDEITKYDMMNGLFMSLIIGLIFSFQTAMGYLLGIIIAIINFRVSLYATIKLLNEGKSKGLLLTIIRIFMVAAITIPFSKNVKLVAFYLLGFMSHYLVLIYCTLKKKGSA